MNDYEYLLSPLDKIKGNDIKLKRTMIRVWIKEKSLQL